MSGTNFELAKCQFPESERRRGIWNAEGHLGPCCNYAADLGRVFAVKPSSSFMSCLIHDSKRRTLGYVVECVVLGFSHCLISPPHQPPTSGAHAPFGSFFFPCSFLVQGRRVVEVASQLAKLATFLTVCGNASSLPVSQRRNRSGGGELNSRMINQATSCPSTGFTGGSAGF